jgi:hypothetical protein
VVLLSTAVEAQQPPAPCATEEYRQFDFWVGEWEVRDPAGKVVGHNSIAPILGGCVLLEEWTSAGGAYSGKSFNVFDRSRKRWHQTWVDVGGALLELDGAFRDGVMVLEGETLDREGKTVRNRITWTPSEDGKVRQHWETSTDGGSTWATAFNGTYAPVTPEAP